MTFHRYFIATCICLTFGVADGGEFKRVDVSATAEWVVHMDFDGIRSSQTGKGLLALPVAEDVKRKLNSMKVLFGVDLLTDVKAITAYGASADKEMADGVILVRSKFDKAKILAVFQLGDGYTEEAYGKHTLLQVAAKPDGRKLNIKNNSWVCFPAAETIVFARRKADLQKGLDVLDGKADSVAQRNPFASLDELEKNAMFVAAANLGRMTGVDPKAKMLQHARSLALCIREDAGNADAPASFRLRIVISGKTPEGSQRIRRSIDGLIAMLQMGMEENPALGQVSKALDHLKITEEDRGVNVRFQYPVDRLIEFVGTLKKLGKTKEQIEPAN